ncbi:MAG: HK97 family phage prohead protease [Afipia sp.]|nr:HK97 family phage prohead protease [Afipia sp.]
MTTLQSRDADPAGLPMQTRVGEINSFDEAARTVEVIFTTGATVRRRRYVGWDTAVPFDETLIVSRDAVNMERLLAGAPALDSHSMYSTFSQVGVVDAARIESGKGLATIRFPSKGVDENADRMAAMVKERIIRNVSVGYTINEVRVEAPEKIGEIEKRIITRWTPYEISFVTIPADKDAQTRAAELELFPFTVTRVADVAVAAARMRMRSISR